MTRFVGATTLVVTAALLTAIGAAPNTDTALQSAAIAWERGDYIAALTIYQDLLAGSEAERVLEPIALQTGELYRTIELTPNGSAARISRDGRYASYETGTGASRATTLVSIANSGAAGRDFMPVAVCPGYGAAFSPDGSILAYLRPVRSGDPSTPQTVITVREIATGRETALPADDLIKGSLVYGSGNLLLFAARSSAPGSAQQVYSIAEGRPAVALTTGPGDSSPELANASGDLVVISTRTGGEDRGGGGRRGGSYSVLTVADGKVTPLNSTDRPSFSGDGKSLAFVARDGDAYTLMVGASADPGHAAAVRSGPERMAATALSPDGTRVAYQLMAGDDWEIYTAARDGSGERRLTREPQDDLLPQFLGADRLLSVIGEARHRRSFMYDLATATRTRLFHNNTIRTIAPEYAWTPGGDGTKLLIAAERDGDTVSPQRGVYVMDLTRKVTREELRARVATNLAAERALQARGKRLFGPIASEVTAVVAEASVARIYGYEKALAEFESKHITKPGNKLASAYLHDTYASFGYEPEMQWFEQRRALDGRTANVIATLKGTANPELIYVASSHYDSVEIGPGADDDSSGTAALLETARIMAGHPQPATIIFASFTGEEAGLLGSREFVRRALADNLQVAGALNNDMIGWANDQRLDNTIRYSNPGIRDVQHGAAMQFTNLITYDALYYKGTDAAAYYEAYGDIVGGIGSYPVLSSPHYHQPHDLLATINHQLVTEVAKTTAATLMLLASSPSRLAELKVDAFTGGTATLSWRPASEKGVTGYLVSYGPPDRPEAQQIRVGKASVTLPNVAAGTVVAVKAVNARGLEGWDAARVVVK